MFLDDILLSTKETVRAAKLKKPLKDLKQQVKDSEPSRGFFDAVKRSKNSPLNLVAEIKQASPSKGLLRESFRPMEIAKVYEESGARALSVLTETRFFLGSLDFIPQVRSSVKLPVLRKDFLIDEYQIYEARAYEADAVLFIVNLLDDYQLEDYSDVAKGIGLDCLIESHTESELQQALKVEGGLIGINNRDLKTFEADIETTFRLLKEVPEERVVVAESGIGSSEDIQRMASEKIDAVLIGETFMKSDNIQKKVQELFG